MGLRANKIIQKYTNDDKYSLSQKENAENRSLSGFLQTCSQQLTKFM